MIRNSAMATSQRVVGCAVIGAVVVLAVTIADWWAVRGAIHASRVGEPIGQWHTGIILILTTAILYGLVFCMLGRGGGDTAPAVTSGRRDINIFLGVVSTIFAWHYLEHGNVALVIGMLLVKLPFTVVVGRVGLWAVDQCRLVIKDFRSDLCVALPRTRECGLGHRDALGQTPLHGSGGTRRVVGGGSMSACDQGFPI